MVSGTMRCAPTAAARVETVGDEQAAHAVASGGTVLVGFYDSPTARAAEAAARVSRGMVQLLAQLDRSASAIAVNVASDTALANAVGVEEIPALVVFADVYPVLHRSGEGLLEDPVRVVADQVEAALETQPGT